MRRSLSRSMPTMAPGAKRTRRDASIGVSRTAAARVLAEHPSADECPRTPNVSRSARFQAGTAGALGCRMDLKVFTHEELETVLRALRNVARANDRFTDSERALVEGVARIHGV